LFSDTDPDANRFFAFGLFWFFVAAVGAIAHRFFRRELTHPNTVLIVGTLVWLAVLLVEAALFERRQCGRKRKAADKAAKAYGEVGVDSWPEA
jgi:hypothetical protein